MTTLHWCQTCGAYATTAIGTLKWRCLGSRRPGTAASCSRIARGLHPQHKQAVNGAYLEPISEASATPASQASTSALPLRASWML
eukprot:932781-Amphidinium_carterae.1